MCSDRVLLLAAGHPAGNLVPDPVERGVLGGQTGGAGPLVVLAQIAEHGDQAVPGTGSVGRAHGLVQGGLGVLPAADVDQDDVVRGEVRPGVGLHLCHAPILSRISCAR